MGIRVTRFRFRTGAALLLLASLPVSGCMAAAAQPYGQSGSFKLLKDWTFGRNRPDATVHTKQDLDRDFYYRYIFAGGNLDNITTYWSYHRDYPDGDPRSPPHRSPNHATGQLAPAPSAPAAPASSPP